MEITAHDLRRACIRVLIAGKGVEMIDWLKQKQYPANAPFTAFFVELIEKMHFDEWPAPPAANDDGIKDEVEKFHLFIQQNSEQNPIEKKLADFIGFEAFNPLVSTNKFLAKRKGRIK